MVTIDPTRAASAATSTSGVSGQNSKVLGQDAFMTLLVTQLQHQDPTAPQDDSAFIAQLAQFSSLEKLTAMDKSLTTIMQLLSPAGASTTPVAPAASSTLGTVRDAVTQPKGTN